VAADLAGESTRSGPAKTAQKKAWRSATAGDVHCLPPVVAR